MTDRVLVAHAEQLADVRPKYSVALLQYSHVHV